MASPAGSSFVATGSVGDERHPAVTARRMSGNMRMVVPSVGPRRLKKYVFRRRAEGHRAVEALEQHRGARVAVVLDARHHHGTRRLVLRMRERARVLVDDPMLSGLLDRVREIQR